MTRASRAWHWPVILVASVCALAVLALAPGSSGAQEEGAASGGARYAADELLVTFEEKGVSSQAVSATSQGVEASEDTRADVEPVAEELGIQLFEFPESTTNEELARIKADLESDPRVAAADYNYRLEAFAVPNDPRFDQQYYLDKIQAPRAYNLEQGSANTRIGVIDSGIQQTRRGTTEHPDLDGKVVAQRDFVGPTSDNTAEDLDSVSHGTAVAGVASAETNNNRGIAGTCPNCSLVIGKFYESEGGFTDDAIEAIRYAVRQDSDVLNLSFGSDQDVRAVERTINDAHARGVTIVASAGNSAQQGNPTIYPAAYRNVIAVGATNRRDQRAPFSSFGRYVDITAPGVSILTTDANPPSTYQRLDGTSFSSPIVAGVAGLLADRGLSNVQIKRRMECTARDLGPEGKDSRYGAGLVNAYRALNQGCQAPEPDPEPKANCNDGRDNDGDGRADLRDPGCSSKQDDRERNPEKPGSDRCTIKGTRGNDVLSGTLRSDRICGLGGDDVIRGRSGNDTLIGGSGRDQLIGSFGNDTLDSKDGVGGNDQLDGGQGSDRFIRDRGDTVSQ